MSVQDEVLALRVIWNRSRPLLEAALVSIRAEVEADGLRIHGEGYSTVEHDGRTFHIGWLAIEQAGEETS